MTLSENQIPQTPNTHSLTFFGVAGAKHIRIFIIHKCVYITVHPKKIYVMDGA